MAVGDYWLAGWLALGIDGWTDGWADGRVAREHLDNPFIQ
jgi:hypothetical protein